MKEARQKSGRAIVDNQDDEPLPIAALSDGLRVALERETGSAYLLGLDLRIRYVNESWRRFARENGAPRLARSFAELGPVCDTASEPLRTFYRAGFARVLAHREPWHHVYQCSSASLFRKLSMRIDLTPQRDGFLVVNSTVVEFPIERALASPVDFDAYVNRHGTIVQCSNCRRVRRGNTDGWDWIPSTLSVLPPNTTFGLCQFCEASYYRRSKA